MVTWVGLGVAASLDFEDKVERWFCLVPPDFGGES